MTTTQAVKAHAEIASKLRSKQAEVAQSEQAIGALLQRHRLAPMSRDTQHALDGHTAQLGRRRRKLARYEVEAVVAQQTLDECHHADQEDARLQADEAGRERRGRICTLARLLAEEEVLVHALGLPEGRRGELSYTHGPAVYAAATELCDALVAHARATGRERQVEVSGVAGIWGQKDLAELIRWAQLRAGGADPAADDAAPLPTEDLDDDDLDEEPAPKPATPPPPEVTPADYPATENRINWDAADPEEVPTNG